MGYPYPNFCLCAFLGPYFLAFLLPAGVAPGLHESFSLAEASHAEASISYPKGPRGPNN